MANTPSRSDGSRVKIPWRWWANAISLDAVAVGVLWNFVFTFQFCDRWPAIYEPAIIGLSIWLVYTADRLFDSLRLDTDCPHSLRHRFHFANRRWLVLIWFGVLLADTAIIVGFANENQLRWGCAAIALVVAYVSGVQWLVRSTKWFPKEFQVGAVFAFGVSLTAWSEANQMAFIPLLVSTLMAGVLFAANCLAISEWERELDASQQFDSFSVRFPWVRKSLVVAMLVHAAIAVVLFAAGILPALVVACLVASDTLLMLLVLVNRQSVGDPVVPGDGLIRADAFVALADVALLVPPLVWTIAGKVVG